MRMPAVCVLLCAPLTLVGAGHTSSGPGAWHAVGKVTLPSAPVGVVFTPDHRLVCTLSVEKRKVKGGNFGVMTFGIYHVRCHDTATGKQRFARELGQLGPRVALAATRLAVADGSDRVTIYDTTDFSPRVKIDTRSANDNPPGANQGVPPEALGFGMSGRLGDIEFTADGKALVSVRMENGPWKALNKGAAFTSEGFQQIVFWDAASGKKLYTLPCEDRNAMNGSLHLLPARNQMLVKFDNGVRLLDLSSRRWGRVLPVKDVYTASVSPDEKTVAITDRAQRVKLFELDGGKEVLGFEVKAVNKTPRLNGAITPSGFEFGPAVAFVDKGKCLRVTLNDGKTVLYRNATTGAPLSKPASETHRFPGAANRAVGLSADGQCAVTTTVPPSGKCTIWLRGTASSGE